MSPLTFANIARLGPVQVSNFQTNAKALQILQRKGKYCSRNRNITLTCFFFSFASSCSTFETWQDPHIKALQDKEKPGSARLICP